MKIAYFIGTLKKGDGAAMVVLDLIKQATSHGIESVIVTPLADPFYNLTTPVIIVPGLTFPLYKEYKLAYPGTAGFAKKLDEFKPDIIHIHSPDTVAWAALKYAKQRNLPILATYHTEFGKYLTYYHLSWLKPLLWELLRKLYNQMSLVTAPSEATALDLVKHGLKNVTAIPWGVDLTAFDPKFRSPELRNKLTKSQNKKILFIVARLTWEKDFRTLVKAYQLLTKKRSDFILVLASDGPIRKKLEALMPEAIFVGQQPVPEIARLHASADIFVFPSTTETFGRVTLEALASGCVPVVANAGGSKSLIMDGQNGLLSKPKNPQDFEEKINWLLDRPELRERLRANGLAFAQNFTWAKVFDQLLVHYQKLANRSEKTAGDLPEKTFEPNEK